MPLGELHRQVASIVLRAAARHGFALAGGCALIAHGLIDRPTEDVDLVTDDEHGLQAAAAAAEASQRAAGFEAERQDNTAGLAEVFPGMGEGLAEWIITARPAAGRSCCRCHSLIAAARRRPWTSAQCSISMTWSVARQLL